MVYRKTIGRGVIISYLFMLMFLLSTSLMASADSFIDTLAKAVEETGEYSTQIDVKNGTCVTFTYDCNDTNMFLEVRERNATEIQERIEKLSANISGFELEKNLKEFKCSGEIISTKRILSRYVIDIETDSIMSCVCKDYENVHITSRIRSIEYPNMTRHIRVLEIKGLDSVKPTATTTPVGKSEPDTGSDFIGYLILVVAVFLVALLVYYRKHRTKGFEGRKRDDKIKQWVELELKEGESPDKLRKSLKASGDDPQIVDKILRRL